MSDQITLFDFLSDDEQMLYKPLKATDWKWKLSDGYPESNGLKVFSCFACGGGSTMGYKLAGCEVLGCCEIDKEMNAIYVQNHHPKHNFLMDIREFNKKEDLPEELYDLDILDGSPPCTTFSMAGQREENWGKAKKFREGQVEQTLDDLAFVFIETAKKLKPKVVIMENVEGLLLGEAWSYVQRIYKDFQNAGYTVHHWLLKGENMGIPQRRHRVFFIAIRDDLGIDPSWLDMSFNYEPILYKDIKEDEGPPYEPGSEKAKIISLIQPGDKDFGDIYRRLGEKEKAFSHMIVWPDMIMPTVTAQFNAYRPEEKTYISVIDMVHAQTFPEDYQFKKFNYVNVSYTCGMSVPPVMIKRIVLRLIEEGVFNYKLADNHTKKL